MSISFSALYTKSRKGRRLTDLGTEGRGLGTAIAEQEFDFLGNAHGPDVSVMGPAKAALIDIDRRVQRFVPGLGIEVASEKRALFESGSSRGLTVLAARPGSRYLRR